MTQSSQDACIVKTFDDFMDDKMHWRGSWSVLLHNLGPHLPADADEAALRWANDWQSFRAQVMETPVMNGSIAAVRELIDTRQHSANFRNGGRPVLVMNVNTDPSIAGIRLDLEPNDTQSRCAWCFAVAEQDFERLDTRRLSSGKPIHHECVGAANAWNRNYPEFKI